MISADAIAQAVERLTPLVRRTAVEAAPTLGPNVWLKCENHQLTGSFKIRGATNAMLALPLERRKRGVVTASSGNHGLGVAHAAQRLGIPATVVVPSSTDESKVRAIRALGATIDKVGDDCVHTEAYARLVAHQTNRAFLSPYNDPDIVAGQATVAHELLEQIPNLDAVFVAIGGGGLISGIGAHLKAHRPSVTIVGCSPAASPAMHRCIEAGRIIDVPCHPTLSGATAGGVEPGAITFDLVRALVDEYVIVGETEIAQAMRDVVDHHHMLIEGAAGVAVAGYRRLATRYAGQTVAIVLCGANVSRATLVKVLAG